MTMRHSETSRSWWRGGGSLSQPWGCLGIITTTRNEREQSWQWHTCDCDRVRVRPWLGSHMTGETSRKCWLMINPVCVLRIWGLAALLWPNARTHTVSDTPPFSLCWWCFFLFLAQIKFPVSDSASRGAQQHKSLFLVWTPCVTQTSVLCFWSGASEVLIAEGRTGVKRERMQNKPMENQKVPSHCDPVPSIWKDTEATAGKWQASNGEFTAAKICRCSGYRTPLNTVYYSKTSTGNEQIFLFQCLSICLIASDV